MTRDVVGKIGGVGSATDFSDTGESLLLFFEGLFSGSETLLNGAFEVSLSVTECEDVEFPWTKWGMISGGP